MTPRLSNKLTFRLLIALIFSICFWSCSPEQKKSLSTEDYYLNHLTFAGKGVVYRYASINDQSLPDEFWHYRFDGGYRGNFLIGTMYTPAGDLVQQSTERLSREKAKLLALDLVHWNEDEAREIAASIGENNSFIFGPIDSMTQTVYQIEYWDVTEDSVRVSLTKHRLMEGPTEFIFEGKTIPAIKVSTTERLETETEGFTETEWSGVEIFALRNMVLYIIKN